MKLEEVNIWRCNMEIIGILSLLALYKFLDMSVDEDRSVEIIDMDTNNMDI